MKSGHLIATIMVFLAQIGFFGWVTVSDPGLATIPVIEFEEQLNEEQIRYFCI